MTIDVGLVLSGLVALAAVLAVPVASRQLRQARFETVLKVWEWFDNDTDRDIRGQIHAANARGELVPGKAIDPHLLGAIQKMATSMDRVGVAVVENLIEEKYIFERYAEVIVTMWDLTGWILDDVRRKKGGGWRYFGPYPSDLTKTVARPRPGRRERLMRRLSRDRPTNMYDRALAYKAAHEPGAAYASARLDGEAPSALPQRDEERSG